MRLYPQVLPQILRLKAKFEAIREGIPASLPSNSKKQQAISSTGMLSMPKTRNFYTDRISARFFPDSPGQIPSILKISGIPPDIRSH